MEDDDEGDIFSSLFVCEDYVTKEFDFNGISLPLLCSSMSTTDHDLTGQIVWPAAKVLSWYISTHQESFHNKTVLELGAGTGLAGFVASKISKRTVITDGNEVVLRLIDKNTEVISSPNSESIARKLMWGEKHEVEALCENAADIPDIIIGADVILWPRFTRALLLTIRWLLSLKPKTSKCVISYVNRAQSTTDLFFTSAETLGLQVKTIDVSTFIPTPVDSADSSSDSTSPSDAEKNSHVTPSPDMRIFEISLPGTLTLSSGEEVSTRESDVSMLHLVPEEDSAWRDDSESLNCPC